VGELEYVYLIFTTAKLDMNWRWYYSTFGA